MGHRRPRELAKRPVWGIRKPTCSTFSLLSVLCRHAWAILGLKKLRLLGICSQLVWSTVGQPHVFANAPSDFRNRFGTARQTPGTSTEPQVDLRFSEPQKGSMNRNVVFGTAMSNLEPEGRNKLTVPGTRARLLVTPSFAELECRGWQVLGNSVILLFCFPSLFNQMMKQTWNSINDIHRILINSVKGVCEFLVVEIS